jgi:hypothetical protein
MPSWGNSIKDLRRSDTALTVAKTAMVYLDSLYSLSRALRFGLLQTARENNDPYHRILNLTHHYSEIGRQRERSGGGKTFGIPRRRRPAGNSNEGRDNKSPVPQYDNTIVVLRPA